jgi:hypothetical protein
MSRRLVAVLVIALVPAMAMSAVAAPFGGDRNPLEATPERRLEHFAVDGRDRLDAITDLGFDVTHEVQRIPTGWEAGIIVDDADVAALTAMGAVHLAPDERFDWTAESEAMRAAVADFHVAARPTALGLLSGAAQDGVDAVDIGRVDRFESKDQQFLSVEAKSSMADASAAMLLLWNAGEGTPAGSGGAQVMTAFVDSGEYMYHRVLAPVEVVPTEVTVVSVLGGSDSAPVQEWLSDTDSLLDQPGYESGFIDGYQDPTTMFARLEELAAEHPDIAEIVDLAEDTNGYQRKAQAVIGSGASAVVVSSVAWGHEGGNDITVSFTSGGASGPGTVTVDGSAITVAVDATTTAGDVIAALDLEAGHLVDAHGYRTSGTGGVVTPTTAPVALTDGLRGPVERGPFDVRAIRIGRHRDGSKPGVLIIAQDHAREWVPPLIAMEAVERLLANHETDPVSADIIENTDIWVIPSNNPDGSHYSFYDNAMQRRNMTNHCGEAQSDPGYRNSWGVDLNRGYSVASRRDGFAGASGTCTSDTYDGPDELSEPETINVVRLVEQHDNIRYFMTIHSNGGQLFWQPGAYIAEGRLTPTRPPLGDELYYWQMAERILSEVKTYQDTVVRPDMVGGSSDVLYSSAGNVREELYVNHGVYAFGWEVGGSTWNPTTRQWQAGSFQPPWSQAQGEYMEYANGITEMFRIAAEAGRDETAPTAALVEGAEGGWTFQTDEPARVFFTTDGTTPTPLPRPTDQVVPRPTTGTREHYASGIREQGEVLAFPAGTTVRWLAVDPSGNESTGSATVTG